MSESNSERTSPPARKNRYWILVFVVLAVMGAAAVTIMLVYNQAQQLSREQLTTAWDLWKQKGPKNYQMIYSTKKNPKETPTKFKVVVRNGTVEDLKTIDLLTGLEFLPDVKDKSHYSMDGLFRDLQRFLDMDEEPGNAGKFTKAVFDLEGDGHLLEFRRVLNRTDRLEVIVEEIKPLPS